MPIQIFSRVKDGSLSQVSNTESVANISFTFKKKQHKYKIDKLWNNGETNKEIFGQLQTRGDIYTQIFWVAFGYTGSGKTYTIYGVLKELLYQLHVETRKEIRVTAYQIYRKNIYDMLNDNTKLRVFKTANLVINGLTEKKLDNIEGFIEMIQANRKLACTNMNDVSSRSHAIIEIHAGLKRYTLVDMAGQECGASGVNNELLVQKQGRSINLNMLALKECIRTFHTKENHIPFRRSLLTLALKPMFLKKCYVAFICTLSATHNTYHQMDSLHYASSLYNDTETEEDKHYFELFGKYTDYINEVGWLGCQEREQWRQMRHGNFDKCHNIRRFLNEKMKQMRQFNTVLKKYEKKLPAIKITSPSIFKKD